MIPHASRDEMQSENQGSQQRVARTTQQQKIVVGEGRANKNYLGQATAPIGRGGVRCGIKPYSDFSPKEVLVCH